MKNTKNLYKGLSKLTKEERTFLAEKYHHTSGKITDDEASKVSGLSKKEYTKERVKIERKLHELIIDDMGKLNKETGFTPFTHKPRKSLDGNRKDIPTGVRYLVAKDLVKE